MRPVSLLFLCSLVACDATSRRGPRPPAPDGLVLVQFAAPDRPLAQRMAQETFADPDVRAALQSGVTPLVVDSTQQPELFTRLLGAPGALATCVLDAQGQLVAARAGYLDADHLLALVRLAQARAGLLRTVRARVARDPRDLRARYEYAEALTELQTQRHAELAFQGLVDLEPDLDLARDTEACQVLARAHERLARLQVRAGLTAAARVHLERFRALDPMDRNQRLDRILISEAMVLSRERRSREALQVLADCGQRFPDSSEADLRLLTEAVAWHECDDRPAALARLDTFFASHGDSSYGDEATLTREHVLAPPHQH